MNPLVPNAYELIVFYIVPVLFVIALVVVIVLVARGRKSTTVEFIADDETDSRGE
ncbi:hypothetical protein [Glutamicibacter halophytocola]|uniref:Uncharacterized protein n=1 Tax=Glutamicibacter halophytocola TaxID=1933880 RepID=A0AA94XPY3_9MICC|nr:hypothetical protein [Glutamicibacter halophytocola]NQD41790.1 hypothetical protein [Glutamicibacter halophytocola]UUX58236.1 hypothetical protein NUH22_13130 [Glutamicibacter halophytocola]